MARKRKQTTKKMLTHRLIALYSITGLLLMLPLILIWYFFNYFGAPAQPDFMAYRPTVQLSSHEASESTLTRVKQSIDGWRFDYETTHSPDGVTMYQRSADNGIGMYGGNCDNSSSTPDYEPICTSRTTKNGKYLVVVGRYKGEISDVSVEGRIGTTGLYVSIPKSKANKYATYDWQRFFDSLEPVDIRAMPYRDQIENSEGL